MSEIPDVVGGETILTSWGNPIRDRVISRYADQIERATLVPVPIKGDPSYLENTDSFELYDGADWILYLPETGGTFQGSVTFKSNIYVGEGLIEGEGINLRAQRRMAGGVVRAARLGVSSAGVTQLSMIVDGGPVANFLMDETQTSLSSPLAFPGGHSTGDLTFESLQPFGQASILSFSPTRVIQRVGFVDTPKSAYIQITGGNDPNVSTIHNGNVQIRVGSDTPVMTIEDSHADGPHARIDTGSAPLTAGVVRNIYTGTAAPTSGIGDVGDVYIQVT